MCVLIFDWTSKTRKKKNENGTHKISQLLHVDHHIVVQAEAIGSIYHVLTRSQA